MGLFSRIMESQFAAAGLDLDFVQDNHSRCASLAKSPPKCADLTAAPRQSFEDEEDFDALTSRFAHAKSFQDNGPAA